MSDAREELAALRRLAELEAKATSQPLTVGDIVTSKLPGFAGEAGKSVLRGVGQMAVGGLDALGSGALDPVTMKPVQNPLVVKAQELLDTSLGKGDNSYFTRGMEGVGNLIGPNQLVARIATGLASGFGGKAGGEAAGKIDPRLAPAGEFIGSFAAGMAPGRGLTGQRQSESILRQNLEGLTDADWQRASRNLTDFEQSGARTGTLVDALNNRQSLVSLANELRNLPGGESFNQRVNARGDDLLGLGEEFVYRTNPPNQGPVQPTNPLAVANQTSDAANAVLAEARRNRANDYRNDLMGVTLPRRPVVRIYSDLMTIARDPSRTDAERLAYAEAARALTRNQGQAVITSLSDLSSNIKSLKANPPGEYASAGAKVDANLYRNALRDLEARLSQVSPEYAAANARYAATSREVVAPLREGPIGRVVDVNPNNEAPTPTSRLDALLGKDNSQAAIAQALAQLSGAGADPRAILQAVSQRKLDLGSTDPGATMRGVPGSPAEGRLNAVIQAGGLDPAQVTQPLRAADNLQNFQNVPLSLRNEMPRSLAGALLTPFRRGEFELTSRSRELNNRQIAEILSRGDQAGLAQLREIAMFDPAVRRMLAAQLAFTSAQGAQGDR